MNKREIGQIGEDYATEFLIAKGYQIVARNFRSRYGEVDIIAVDNQLSRSDYPEIKKGLFIEVKTRTSLRFGLPQEAITYHKHSRLLKTIFHYFSTTPTLHFNSWRIDVIAVILNKNTELKSIEHFKNIYII